MKGIRKMDEMELQITLRAAVPPGSPVASCLQGFSFRGRTTEKRRNAL